MRRCVLQHAPSVPGGEGTRAQDPLAPDPQWPRSGFEQPYLLDHRLEHVLLRAVDHNQGCRRRARTSGGSGRLRSGFGRLCRSADRAGRRSSRRKGAACRQGAQAAGAPRPPPWSRPETSPPFAAALVGCISSSHETRCSLLACAAPASLFANALSRKRMHSTCKPLRRNR